jgi:hypothetical protein
MSVDVIRSPPEEKVVLGTFEREKNGETVEMKVYDTISLSVMTLPSTDSRPEKVIVSVGGSALAFYPGHFQEFGLQAFKKRKGRKVFTSYQQVVGENEDVGDVVAKVRDVLEPILNGVIMPVPFTPKHKKKKTSKNTVSLADVLKRLEFLEAKVLSQEREIYELKNN